MSINYTVQKDLDVVKQEISDAISQEVKKDWVKTSWKDNQLCVKIEKGGSSEFLIDLKKEGNNVNISEAHRKIALFHKPFIGDVEKMIDKLLTKSGAKKV